MTNEAQRQDLVTKLVADLLADPRALELDAHAMTRRVNWTAKVDINDIGKLIGKKGAHLKALNLIVSLLGQRFGEDWRFSPVDPDDRPLATRDPVPDPQPVDRLSVAAFLREVLGGVLDEDPEITVEQRAASDLTFVVRARAVQDYERLVEEVVIREPYTDREGVDRPAERLAPVAAIGTLFRAYGLRLGWKFRVEVPGRKAP